jgi:hypothetical protein
MLIETAIANNNNNNNNNKIITMTTTYLMGKITLYLAQIVNT